MSDIPKDIAWILEKCKEKLEIYYKATNGRYYGGQESSILIREIDRVLVKQQRTG